MTVVAAGPAPAARRGPTLDDKYLMIEGRVYLTGVQALARVVLDQMRADRRAGLHTAAMVSGYQGSPLGGLGQQIGVAARLDPSLAVTYEPGLNEELGATSVWGSQLVSRLPKPRYAGVLGVWYGKAPGVDRAADALRHGNACGAHPVGGLLALCGDDPQCKSSSLPSASETLLAALGMPVWCPANVQEILDLGAHAVAASRASGLWVGLKVVVNVADSNGTADVAPDRIRPVVPIVEYAGRPYRHTPSGSLLAPTSLELERTLRGPRLELARAYARENELDRIAGAAGGAWLGIVAAGSTYFDVLEALRRLGLPEEDLARRGVRLLKLAQIWPLDHDIVGRFATGLDEIVVVEEKAEFIESAVKNALYQHAEHPLVVGKHDEGGAPLVPAVGVLDADLVARILAGRLRRRGVDVASPSSSASALIPIAPRRTPAYCSGCPHNHSTAAPDDAVVGVGIGCHTMVILNPAGRGELAGLTQMGGEGAQWIGQAPFTETGHIFQNLGDGTYHHSGSLAVRAAVAAAVNITFKLLHNRAVAMTGGQDLRPALSVPDLSRQLEAEGVRQIVITTEDPDQYDRRRLAPIASIRHRSELPEVQRELAAVRGVTVLIHDEQCAAEKRRLRKRGRLADPPRRVMINPRVCEGCGDCVRRSGCVSVRPSHTEYGRKTAIHQSSCNKDYSCADGDCPSFVSVWPEGTGTQPHVPPPTDLPQPIRLVGYEATIRLIGVGGTGLVTVAQILGMAAFLDGRQVRGLDQTGLAQKGGPVVSDVRIFTGPPRHANRAGSAEVDAYLGMDLLGAVDPQNLATARPGRTVAAVSTSQVPTVSMVLDQRQGYGDASAYVSAVAARTCAEHNVYLDAQVLAERLCGDAIAANTVVFGAAWQRGAIPVTLESIEAAIRLNGTDVERTLAAFHWGRCAVAAPHRLDPSGAPQSPAVAAAEGTGGELARLLRVRVPDLTAYQDAAYAEQYRSFVAWVQECEHAVVPDSSELAEAVARNLYQLMAYKDEYEVARLSVDPAFVQGIRAEFGPGARWAYHLHPPFLRALGLGRKLVLGPWIRPVLRVLAALRRLRGTPLDVFGYTAIRRLERRLPAEYRECIVQVLARLEPTNLQVILDLAEAPDLIRGYERIKLDGVAAYRDRMTQVWAQLDVPTAPRQGQEDRDHEPRESQVLR